MKLLKKIVCILLCVSAVMLSSCSETENNVVVSYKSGSKNQYSLDSGFMYFWISLQKSVYATVADTYENGWEQIVDEKEGTTLADLLMTESKESAKKLIVIEYLHDSVYKLTLSDTQKDTVANRLDSLTQSFGSETALNSALSRYGADKNTIKKYYELMLKQNNLYEHFYGENGIFQISEQDKKQYFEDNYSIADHIYFKFPTENAETEQIEQAAGNGETDEAGKTDNSEDLETLIQQKRDKAFSVYQRIKNAGEDFDTLKAEYDEDTFDESYYPKGFFVTNDSSFPVEFTSAIMSMNVGDITMVETPDTGVHIIRKLKMDSSLYNEYDAVLQSITSALCAEDFASRIGEYTENVSVDEHAFESYDPMLIPAFALE